MWAPTVGCSVRIDNMCSDHGCRDPYAGHLLPCILWHRTFAGWSQAS